MSARSVNRVLESALYLMEYVKFQRDDGIYYAFYHPRDIKIQKLELRPDAPEEYINYMLGINYSVSCDDKHLFPGIRDVSMLDTTIKTDPLVYVRDDGSYVKYVVREELKSALRQKFGVKPLKPSEEFGSMKTLLGIADPEAAVELNTNVTAKNKKPESLEQFLKRTKKVTRHCLKLDCNEKISVYRSDMRKGRGLFCCTNHSNEYKSWDRVINICKTCKLEYSSLQEEDFCCDECAEYWCVNNG